MLFLIVKVVWLQQQSFFIKHQLEAEANLTFNSMHFGLSFALSVQHSHDHFFLSITRMEKFSYHHRFIIETSI
jgi:hypothetical protein